MIESWKKKVERLPTFIFPVQNSSISAEIRSEDADRHYEMSTI